MESFTNQIVDDLHSLIASKEIYDPPFYSTEKRSYNSDLETRFKLLRVHLYEFLKNSNVDNEDFDVFFKSFDNLTSGIISSINAYLKGDPRLAYQIFNERLNCDALLLSYLPFFSVDLNYSTTSNDGLYRVRLNESHLYKPEEMFHIPFEKRHLVKSQRYSIAGLPSLYLGSSIFCCWEEMNRPDLNKLYISKFKVQSGGVKVLNFAYRLSSNGNDLYSSFKINDLKEKVAKLIFYPVLMACSYVKKYENAPFNEEYIIPNMLLLWIREVSDPIDGIAYYSNKTFQNDGHQLGINFVFPPRKSHEEGFCLSLVEKFKLSKPISWQLLDTLPIKGAGASNFYGGAPAINNVEDEFFEYYRHTGFGKQEFKLKDVEVFSILTAPSS
jgi:hypothetical protein